MPCHQYLYSKFDCLVFQSLFITPWDDLMAMDKTNLQSCYFDDFLLGQILKSIVLEISFDRMKIIRQRFNPIVYLPASHIASTHYSIDFVRCNHFSIFSRNFGSSMRDMEISKKQNQHAHFLLISHVADFTNNKQILISNL